MEQFDIRTLRLYNQRLAWLSFADAEQAVRFFGAVQAQDYSGAKWALAQRTGYATSAGIDEAFNRGCILSTHLMRPTWHFVLPEDARWLLSLTAPRVHAANAYYYRKFELDESLLDKTQQAIVRALAGGNHLTRNELAGVLAEQGVQADGLRMGYKLMNAELNGSIISGVLRGKQHTYALFDERVPASKVPGKEESLRLMALRYFAGHGPAQIKDFSWWSGLTMTDCKQAVELAKDKLDSYKTETGEYWAHQDLPQSYVAPKTSACLLPNYDEYLIAYKNRSPTFDPARFSATPPAGMFDRHITVIDSFVMGAWGVQVHHY